MESEPLTKQLVVKAITEAVEAYDAEHGYRPKKQGDNE